LPDKVAIFTPILERLRLTLKNLSFPTVIPLWIHATLASELSKSQFFTSFGRLTLMSCAGPHQICTLPNVWTPTCAQKKFTLHQCLGVRHTRSLQTVATGKEDSHFTTPHVSPSDTRHLRRGLRKDKQDPHFATRLGVRYAAEGNISYATAWLSLPQREIEELEKSDFAGLQIQFDHLEVS